MNLLIALVLLAQGPTAPETRKAHQGKPKKNEAEELFRKMEAMLIKAETVQLEWSMTAKGAVAGNGEGTLFLETPKKVRLNLKIEVAGRKEEGTIISDGKRTKRITPRLPDRPSEKTGSHIRDMMILFVTRSGFLMGPGALDTPNPKDYGTINPKERLLVSQFKLTDERKFGERVAQGLSYNLSFGTRGEAGTITLWVDKKTALPIQRVMSQSQGGKVVTLTETYSNVKLNEKIDPKTFELPKEEEK